jgi:metallo-beta-lactamase family protein
VKARGNVIIPTFAIERAQELMYHLNRLVWSDRIPYMMMFLDSPMAVNVTDVFLKHMESLDRETRKLLEEGKQPFQFPGLKLIRSVAESKAINSIRGSCIIMAGSGMCTGGRVKHHLVQNISRPESTIIFVGYQAFGTLGRQILEGKEQVRILGKQYKVRAKVREIRGFSAHADKDGLFKWINHLRENPKTIFLTHGEYDSANIFSERIKQARQWKVQIPEYMQSYKLDSL